MTELECAYIAGLIDGEGSLAIYQNGPRLSISNRHVSTLEWVKELVGHGRIWQPQNHSQFNRSAPCYQWDCGANGCRILLPKILPYSRINKDRIEALLEFLRMVSDKEVRNSKLDPFFIEQKEQLKKRINGRLIVWGDKQGV